LKLEKGKPDLDGLLRWARAGAVAERAGFAQAANKVRAFHDEERENPPDENTAEKKRTRRGAGPRSQRNLKR